MRGVGRRLLAQDTSPHGTRTSEPNAAANVKLTARGARSRPRRQGRVELPSDAMFWTIGLVAWSVWPCLPLTAFPLEVLVSRALDCTAAWQKG